MNWTDIFTTLVAIFTSIGSAGVIIFALSSWLGKVWASRILENEKRQYATELEGHKSDLAKLKKEHEITFASLHEKRGEVIEIFYSKLIDTDASFHSLIKPFQEVGEASITEKFKSFVDAYNGQRRYFQKKRIYFSPAVCKIVDELNQILFESHVELTMYPIDWDSPEFVVQPELAKEKRENWMKAWDTYNNEVTRLKSELEASFRSILRVEQM